MYNAKEGGRGRSALPEMNQRVFDYHWLIQTCEKRWKNDQLLYSPSAQYHRAAKYVARKRWYAGNRRNK